MGRNNLLSRQSELFFSLCFIVIVAGYMPLFMFLKNSTEQIKASDVLQPIIIFVAIGYSLFFVGLAVTKKVFKTTLSVIIVIFAIENYRLPETLIRHLLPSLKYWHFAIIYIVVLLHIAYFLYSFMEEDSAKIISTIVGGFFCVLTILNLVMALPNIVKNIEVTDKMPIVDSVEGNFENDGANIYYLVMDEGASLRGLKEYYNYEAEEFRDILEKNCFAISDTSYNDNPYTFHVMTNIINLDYVVDASASSSELKQFQINPPLIHILETSGYSVVGVGVTQGYGISSFSRSKPSDAETISGESFLTMGMQKTILYPFFQDDLPSAAGYILKDIECLEKLNYDVKSRFLIAHINSPHQPFYFDENGNMNPASVYSNWIDKQYYLNQYKYVLKRIRHIIQDIVDNDPDSIIVITSDHGPRYNPEIPQEEITNIFNAVYFKGEIKLHIEGLSGVNTLRLVLSEQLNIDLPEV